MNCCEFWVNTTKTPMRGYQPATGKGDEALAMSMDSEAED